MTKMRVTSTETEKTILLKIITLVVVFLTAFSPAFAQTNNESLQPYPINVPQFPNIDEKERETVFWKLIEKSTDVNEFIQYLNEFPNGVFVALAQSKIRELQNAKQTEPNEIPTTQPKQRTKLENTKDARENLYNNFFLPNYKSSATIEQRKIAYNAALDYLYNFSADNDDIVKYLQRWVSLHSNIHPYNPQYKNYQKFNQSIYQGNIAEIFAIGKEILNKEPDFLNVIFYMVDYGYMNAHIKRTDTLNEETIFHAKQAIDKIKAGTMPIQNDWKPSENKEHALSWMNYVIGYLYEYRIKDKKSAAPYFYEAVRYKYKLSDDFPSQNSRSNLSASYHPYALLGNWYLDQYNQSVVDYNRGKNNLNIKEARKDEVANAWKKYADLALNAYAHAYSKAKSPTIKREFKNTLLQLYKYRNSSDLLGFESFITTESRKSLADFPVAN